MEHGTTNENNRVARDDEDRKPRWKSAVLRIGFAPVADTQGDDAAEEQTFVSDRIENYAKCAPLVIASRDVAIESVTNRSEQKDGDGGKTLPFKWVPALNALAVVNCHRDEGRNH